MPFDVNVHDLDTALAVVEGAGAANGGLAIDVWHMTKLGIPPSEVGRIPLRYLSWVELNDGRREDMPDLVDETVNHRLLPGEGEFDVRGYVDACRRAGYAGPWGVEVLSAELRELPMEEIFSRAYLTTSAQLSAPVTEESRS
jgi:sugar phosphate isomerase/epimerase